MSTTERQPERCALSIIIPVLNDASALAELLTDLTPVKPADAEIIVVDGGSSEAVDRVIDRATVRLLNSAPGRARQMNAGAAAAQGNVLWFLHADSRISAAAPGLLQALLLTRDWGFFRIGLSGQQSIFRLIETLMNTRSCLTGIATGDQGLFVRHELFSKIGGFPEIDLMEDIAISRQLKRHSRPGCIPGRQLLTSSRRWEQRGVLRTVLLMWRLRLAYFCGADPAQLAKVYG